MLSTPQGETLALRGLLGGTVALRQRRSRPSLILADEKGRDRLMSAGTAGAEEFLDALAEAAEQSRLVPGMGIAPCEGPKKEERAKLQSAPSPEYPARLRDAGITGRVLLFLVVTEAGAPDMSTLKVLDSAHPDLTSSTIRSLSLATFRPATREGRPVACRAIIPYNFRLRAVRRSARP